MAAMTITSCVQHWIRTAKAMHGDTWARWASESSEALEKYYQERQRLQELVGNARAGVDQREALREIEDLLGGG